MRIEVKLYSYHDMDLVGLYKTGKIVFPETTRQILNSYAKKEVYRVKLLDTNYKRLARYPSDSYRKYYHYHVVLDEEKDADAIDLLNHITPGYRNNFIKVLLRQYLCGALLSAYSVDDSAKLFREMSDLFQGDMEEREIKQTKTEVNQSLKKKHVKKDMQDKTGKKNNISKSSIRDKGNANSLKRENDKTDDNKNIEAGTDAGFEAQLLRNSNDGNTENKKGNYLVKDTVGAQQQDSSTYSSMTAPQQDAGLNSAPGDNGKPGIGFSSDNDKNDNKNNVTPSDIMENMEEKFDDDDFDDFLDGTTEQY